MTTHYVDRSRDVLHATRKPLGDGHTYDGSYHHRKPRPFVHAVTKCAICGVVRDGVNGVCLVCRANGAGDCELL